MTLPLANIFEPLIKFSEGVMKFFHNQVGLGWGFSIVGLTVVIRLLILPLTYRQVRSMQALQRLQPQMKALQERFKDDKQRLNQEMMTFYREHKVNPLGACLPVLLQFPFFISLFYMLRHDLRRDVCGQVAKPCSQIAGSHGENFLFVHDITTKATGAVLIALIVLYVGSQLLAGLITTFTADKQQRIMMMALPIVFVTFIVNFPAGLIVYWITTNFWTVGQQLFIKRFLPTPEPLPVGATAVTDGKPARGKPPAPKPAAAEEPAPARRIRRAKAEESSSNGEGAKAAPPPGPRKKKKRSGRRR